MDGGDPDVLGNSVFTLNDLGDSLKSSLTVSGLDFDANGLIEGVAHKQKILVMMSLVSIFTMHPEEKMDLLYFLSLISLPRNWEMY